MQLGFALDCHDPECLGYVAAARDLVARDIQQLQHHACRRPLRPRTAAGGTDSVPDGQRLHLHGLGTLCTAERLHLVPITTPAASPESNGMHLVAMVQGELATLYGALFVVTPRLGIGLSDLRTKGDEFRRAAGAESEETEWILTNIGVWPVE